MRVVVVNAKGGQALGLALARWLRRRKPLGRPLVALISECDGPNGANDRIANALTARMRHARLYRGSKDHGAREVAVMILGRAIKVHTWESIQLTEGSGWSGGGQDRWATVVRATYRRHKIAPVALHASTTQPATIQPKLQEILDGLRADGYKPILGGDLNEWAGPKSVFRPWARRNHLAAFSTRVMWALIDPAFHAVSKALPLRSDISDHPTALSVRVRVPRGKR